MYNVTIQWNERIHKNTSDMRPALNRNELRGDMMYLEEMKLRSTIPWKVRFCKIETAILTKVDGQCLKGKAVPFTASFYE